jgi:small subunit ribosomal protein S20
MANYPSAIKRNRQTPKRRARNRLVIGKMRSALKTARHALETGQDDKQGLFRQAVQAVDKAVTKGAVKRRTASRTISRLARALQKNDAAAR